MFKMSSIQTKFLFFIFFFLSQSASAALIDLKPGYPRFTLSNMLVTNSGVNGSSSLATSNGITLMGTQTSLFIAENQGKIKFTENSSSPTIKLGSPSAFMWAEIDPSTNTVLQGRIDIFGDLFNVNGLQFGADIANDTLFSVDKIGFGQINHVGNVCDLGFCTFIEELLLFKNLNFSGDFSQGFQFNSKVISTVPLPNGAWLFISGILGLFIFKSTQIKLGV